MPDLGMVTTTIRRGRGNLPQMPLVNMFSEKAVTEPRQFSLQSFPGLTATGVTLGVGPIKALLLKDGVAGGLMVGVSAGALYIDAVDIGVVTGSGPASIAGNEIGTIATSGAAAVFWDTAVFSTINFPDGANVRKVFEQGGRFLFLRDETQRFYWTEPLALMLGTGGAVVINGVDYASAESEPDKLVDALPMEDALVIGGTATIEFWSKTGDVDLPYVPSTGRVFQKGVKATGCMVTFDNSFAWVSPENIVYRAGNVPERVSDAGIEEIIAASSGCRVDTYFFEGHEFLKISLDDETIEYDAQTGQWNKRKTGIANFRGGAVAGGLFGSLTSGALYELSGYLDIDGYHERSFCAGFPLNGGAVVVDNVTLRTNPGQTEYLTGDYTNPVVEMFQSYDGGMTFENGMPENLGEQGHYRREVEWRALGFADAPGFFGKFRVTDPVPFRVSGASFNERGGGRSR